jgi:hypothetical protein
MEPQILHKFEEKEAPTLEEPYVPSIEQPQDPDVKPTSIEEEEESPIIKEDISTPIQALHELRQDANVEPPFEVETRKEVEPEQVKPSFEEVPRSLELPISHTIEESQGDVGVEAMQEGEHASEVEEPQIPHKFEAQDKEALTLEEPDVPSTKQPQDKDVQPKFIEEEEEIPIVKEDKSDPIQALHEFPQDGDSEAPFEVPTKKVELEEVEPSFQEVLGSLELPINHPIEEAQGDVGVEAVQDSEHVSEVEEPQIEDPITESQILDKFEAQEKEAPTLEKPYVPSIEQPQDQDVQPTSIKEKEKTPIIKEDTSAPIQAFHELPRDDDVEAPFEVATRKEVEPKKVEPNFEEVPRSLELPINHLVEETQGDVGVEALQGGEHVSEVEEPQVHAKIPEPQILPKFQAHDKDAPTLEKQYVPSTEQPRDEDVQPTYIEEQQDTPNIKEDTSNPIQTLEELPQDNDVQAPSEVPTKRNVEPEEVEPSFEEVQRSQQLPISHPIEETQGNVGVKALQEGQHVSEVEEPQIDPPITKPETLCQFEAQLKEGSKLQEPYVPSTEQPQDANVKPTSIEEQEETPIVKEGTSTPIQAPHELPQDNDVEAPSKVTTRKEVEPEQVESSSEAVPRSLELPISHPLQESQGDVGVEALQEGEHVSEVEEPQIPRKFEAEEKKVGTLEEPNVPSIEQPQDKDLQPTSIEEEEETPIIKEHTSDPIQTLDEVPQDVDVEAPFEVSTKKKVEPEEKEPSFDGVPKSLEPPISQPIEETQGDVGVDTVLKGQDLSEVKEPQIAHKFEAQGKEGPTLEEPYVPSTKQPQDQDLKHTSIEKEDETLIVKEDTSASIQTLHERPQDSDVEAPFEVATRKEVEPEEVEPSFEEVPSSLELLISHHVEETQGNVGVVALQEGQHVSKVEESQIDAPITKPQILHKFEPQEEEAPYVPSTEQSQDVEVKPTCTDKEEGTLINKEDTTNPIQTLNELPQYSDVEAPFQVPTEKKVEAEEMEPSSEEVLRSLELPISHPIEETKCNLGVKVLQEGQHVPEVEEPQIDAPIIEPQILRKFEAQEKEGPTREEPYVPSIQQPQDQDVKPTSIEEQEETPIIKEDTSVPTQTFHELPQDGDVEAPFKLQTRKEVKPEEVQPSFEEVPRPLELPISHHVEETQHDVGVEALEGGQLVAKVEELGILQKFEAQEKEAPTLEEPYVPSTKQPQNEDVQPTSIEAEEETPIIKENTSDPIEKLEELPQDGDMEAPFEVPTEKKVEAEEVEPSFEDVSRSLELPMTHPIEETQGHVQIEALQEGQHVYEVEEPQIDAPITEPEILHKFETEDKEGPTLQEPYFPSTKQPQDEEVQPTSSEEEEETPIVKEEAKAPIQTLDELPQDGDLEATFEVPIEKEVEPKEVEPGFDKVTKSLELPISHPIEETLKLPISQPIEETQEDVGVKAQVEGQHFSKVEEPQIEAPIIEPQILKEFETQDQEAPILEEQFIPSTEELEVEDVKPASIEKEETPNVEEEKNVPMPTLDELPQHGDVEEPLEVQAEKEVEPSFEEVPRSLELPTIQPIEETQDNVGTNASMEGQDVSEVEEPQIEALNTEMNTPIQTLDELSQHGDIEELFKVSPIKEVEPSFKEVPKSLEVPISQPIEETQEDVGIEAPMEGQALSEVEVPLIKAPITEPQLHKSKVQDKKAPMFEEQHMPSIEEAKVEDVKLASTEVEEAPIVKEEKNTPIQTLYELPQQGDVEEAFEVQMEKEVEPGFEKVPRSLELPISPPIGEIQEHVGIEVPISPPIEETQEDVEGEGFQLVEDASPLENVRSISIQQATSVEGDNWRTWKRELEANATDKLFAQENLAPIKESKNGDILEGPWPRVGSALEESIVSTKDPCGNDESEALNYLSCQKYHVYVFGNVHLM